MNKNGKNVFSTKPNKTRFDSAPVAQTREKEDKRPSQSRFVSGTIRMLVHQLHRTVLGQTNQDLFSKTVRIVMHQFYRTMIF